MFSDSCCSGIVVSVVSVVSVMVEVVISVVSMVMVGTTRMAAAETRGPVSSGLPACLPACLPAPNRRPTSDRAYHSHGVTAARPQRIV